MGGWVDGWIGGWVDGWIGGWVMRQSFLPIYLSFLWIGGWRNDGSMDAWGG